MLPSSSLFCSDLSTARICAKLLHMKQNIRLSMFALCLLVLASAKQTFALDNNRFGHQQPGADTAKGMATRVNAHREEAGLTPYVLNDALTSAAQQVADHMAATEFTSHYDGNGANPSQRALQAGYTDHVTEIIYGGFGGAEAAWTYWKDNELHHDLIVSEDYHEFGVGMAVGVESGRMYWAVMLGTGLPEEKPLTAVTPIIPGTVTKLPGAATAVPTPAATSDQSAAETTATDTTVTLTALDNGRANDNAGTLGSPDDGTTPAPAKPANEDTEDSPWMIVAAALTILAGVVFFYFPRARWARSSS